MEIIYRTKDGSEFSSKKEAEKWEKRLDEQVYKGILSIHGFIKVKAKAYSPYEAAREIYTRLDNNDINLGDIDEIDDVEDTEVTIFDENGNEHTFSPLDCM